MREGGRTEWTDREKHSRREGEGFRQAFRWLPASLGPPPPRPRAITWRYTSSTQSRDALRVQPRLRGETAPRHGTRNSLAVSLSRSSVCYGPPISLSLSPSAAPAFLPGLSLSRQMATITYMCQYITHTARSPSPSSTKCTTTRSSVYPRCSHPIPHPSPPSSHDSIRAVVVRRLAHPRFSQPPRFFPIRCPSRPSLLTFPSLLSLSLFLFFSSLRLFPSCSRLSVLQRW